MRTTLAMLVVLVHPAAHADEADALDYADLSLEQLMDIDVVSVSRKKERRSEVPAALYVVTAGDIRRSGVRTVADAMRLAPGVHVARVDANTYAVSIRGLGGSLSRAVLVLVDGRSVYTPFFAGTYWETQDVLLADIDRIEIIRGPGGTLWGANAVNGIVNIITKPAADTVGGHVELGGGTEELAFAGFRLGDASDDVAWRAYAKADVRGAGDDPDGADYDHFEVGRAGFRVDLTPGTDTVTVDGSGYFARSGVLERRLDPDGATRRPTATDATLAGAALHGRWTRALGDGADLQVHGWYSFDLRDEPLYREGRHTGDVGVQHHLSFTTWDDLTWGVGARVSGEAFEGSEGIRLREPGLIDRTFSLFVHEEVRLFDDALRLSAGTKLEHNVYSGVEVQPSARVLWRAHPQHTLWAAFTRAVRAPSRIDHHIGLDSPTAPGMLVRVDGSDDFESEVLLATEAGYRLRPLDALYLDLAGFYNVYEGLTSIEPAGAPFVDDDGTTITPTVIGNGVEGTTVGGEAALNAEVAAPVRLTATYGLIFLDLKRREGFTDLFDSATSTEEAAPRHVASLRLAVDLPASVEVDTLAYYVSAIEGPDLDAYVRLDARVGWRPAEGHDLSVVGQNLLEDTQAETASGTGVQRGVYGRYTWTW